MRRAFDRLASPSPRTIPADRPRRNPGRLPRPAAIVAALSALAVLSAPGALLAVPAAGEESGAAAPSHEQVVEMLRGGIDEEVILAWLDAAGRPLPLPTAEELLALREAGATNGLLAALIERARPAAPGETDAPAAAPEPAPPRDDSPAPAPPPAAAPPAAPAPAGTAGDAGGVLVLFRLAHRPRLDDGDDLGLYVYLDGKPLSYVPASGSLLGGGEPLTFTQRLAPGVHRLRAAFESHDEERGGRRRHEAYFAPASLSFELQPGAPAEILVEVADDVFGVGKLTYRFEQEERVGEIEDAEGDPERWTILCEDIAADTSRRSDRERRRLEQGCIAWDALWPEGGAPARDEVREALARFDYKPVPVGS